MKEKIEKVPLTEKDLIFLKKYRREIITIIPLLFVVFHIILFLVGLINGYKKSFFDFDALVIESLIFVPVFLIIFIPLQIHITKKHKFITLGKIDKIVTTAHKAKLYVRNAMALRYGVYTEYAMSVNGKYYPVPETNKINIKKGQSVIISFLKFPKKIINIEILQDKYQ